MHGACPFFSFFFHDPATTEIYTLSLHDALPICGGPHHCPSARLPMPGAALRQSHAGRDAWIGAAHARSEEHTSELQSHVNLVCRLLLEKKKKKKRSHTPSTSHNIQTHGRHSLTP